MKSGIIIESNKEYHGYVEAISKSRLAKLSVCPQYFKWCEDNPQEPTSDLVFGSAFHKAVLEPNTFNEEFAILPIDIDRRTKAGKDAYNKFLIENANKEIISTEDYENIIAMKSAVENNKYSKSLLNGECEQSMYYIDDLTGIECKVRPDCRKQIKDRIVIVDLKSCKSAAPEDFMRDVVKYAYDLQVAMYKIGASKTLDIPLDKIDFVFIAIEKKAPHLMGIYEANEDIFNRGESLYRKYLGTLKQCIENKDWYDYNGFTHAPMILGLPDYLLKKEVEHG